MPDNFDNLEPVSFGAFFMELPSDLSDCTACRDQMFGKMYVPATMISDAITTQFNDMPVKLCASCYELPMGRYEGPEGIG